MKTKCYFTGY